MTEITEQDIIEAFLHYEPEVPPCPRFRFPKRFSRRKRKALRAKARRFWFLRCAGPLISEEIIKLSQEHPNWLRDLLPEDMPDSCGVTINGPLLQK